MNQTDTVKSKAITWRRGLWKPRQLQRKGTSWLKWWEMREMEDRQWNPYRVMIGVNVSNERKYYWNKDLDVQIGSLIVFQENKIKNHTNIYSDVVSWTS